MKRNIIIFVIALTSIIILFSSLLKQENSVATTFDTHISKDAEFEDAEQSDNFIIEATIIITEDKNSSAPLLNYDVLIKSKYKVPIKNLRATAFLNTEIIPYIASPLTVFGNSEDTMVNLVNGETPYGLSISRTTNIINYSDLSDTEREHLLGILKNPIRLKLTFDSGQEYLEINSSNIFIENRLLN